MVKLKIEMSMADLIGKIARNRHCGVISEGDFSGSMPTNSGSGGSRNRDSRVFDAELARAGRRPQYVTFELRSVGTGTDVGSFVGTGSILERSRFASTGDSGGTVNRPDVAKTHSVMGGINDARNEVHHYGNYGVGIKKSNSNASKDLPPVPPPHSTGTRKPVASVRRHGEEGGTWFDDRASRVHPSPSREVMLAHSTIYEEDDRRAQNSGDSGDSGDVERSSSSPSRSSSIQDRRRRWL